MSGRKFRYRKAVANTPPYYSSGELAVHLPRSMAAQRAEVALIIEFMMRRFLFGLSYSQMQPDYFFDMPRDSGVFIKPLIPTRCIFTGRDKPGDIDLLIIPYEGNQLVLERVLAIEFKVIRASFQKQGRSPNDYGFSQAESLLSLGLPYVAVGHLIVSDESPEKYWQEILCCKVLDEDGLLSQPWPVRVDTMPSRLVERAHGRLLANRTHRSLGLLAAYLTFSGDPAMYRRDQESTKVPSGSPALLNPKRSKEALDAVAGHFEQNYKSFFRTPRFDPV
jgi:hypothetical protein